MQIFCCNSSKINGRKLMCLNHANYAVTAYIKIVMLSNVIYGHYNNMMTKRFPP